MFPFKVPVLKRFFEIGMMVLLVPHFASGELVSIEPWKDLASVADRLSFKACAGSIANAKGSAAIQKSVDSKCSPLSFARTTDLQPIQISEEALMAGLAEQRATNNQCALESINAQLQDEKAFESLAENLEEKLEILAEEILLNFTISDQIRKLMSSKTLNDKAMIEQLRQQIQENGLRIQALYNSIDHINTKQISDLISRHVGILTEKGSGVGNVERARSELNSAAFRIDLKKALGSLTADMKVSVQTLNDGAKSHGKSLKVSMRESLAQDNELIAEFFVRNPDLKEKLEPARCQMDVFYGRGAKQRDHALEVASLGLTVGSLGLSLGARAVLGGTAAIASRLVTTTGYMTLKASRILSMTSLYPAGAVALKSALGGCEQVQVTSSSNKCEEFNLAHRYNDDCYLAAVLMTAGANATPSAVNFVSRQLGTKAKSLAAKPMFLTCTIGEAKCWTNSHKVLDLMKQSGTFDMSKAKVLYVSNIDQWKVHAIVEYNGHIYDASKSSAHFLNPVPVAQYFKMMVPDRYSMVREVPANHYLRNYGRLGPDYYQAGLDVTRSNVSRDAQRLFPLRRMSDYLRSP